MQACMPLQTHLFKQLHDLGLLTGNVIVSQLLFLESQHPTKPVRSHCSSPSRQAAMINTGTA